MQGAERHLDATVGAKRRVHDRFKILTLKLVKRGLKAQARLTGRLGALDVDHTTDGISAKQGSLRSAQDFDRFYVEQVHIRTRRRGVEDAVH